MTRKVKNYYMVKNERNIMHAVKRRKASEIVHFLHRNCLPERKKERKRKEERKGTERRGGRRQQLLYDFKEKRRYRHLKQETLDRTVWKIHFGRGHGPVTRQTAQ
jgi:hypothetical protein